MSNLRVGKSSAAELSKLVRGHPCVPSATCVADFSIIFSGPLPETGSIASSSRGLRGNCTTPDRHSTAWSRLPPDLNAPFVSA